ncbi:MAG: hypothetical protein GY867_12785 [bacterium]|nr:hypothetical protein [bacterium]
MRAFHNRHLGNLLLLLIMIVTGLASLSLGDVPGKISYQGKLVDDAGNPVPDDQYEMLFYIYDSPTGDIPSWGETQKVDVVDGMFSVLLGSETPIETWAANFGMYLGISVNGGAEMSPRPPIVTVPYAFIADVADSVRGEPYLNEEGDTLSGGLVLHDGTGMGGRVSLIDGAANLILADNGATRSKLYGQEFGTLILYDTDGDVTATLDAHRSSGGELRLEDSTGIMTFQLRSHVAGDDGTILPYNAVNSYEMLDEPGIAHAVRSGAKIADDGAMHTLVGVYLTTPGPGYVYARGDCYAAFYDPTGPVEAYFQIDTAEGGGPIGLRHVRVHHDDDDAIGAVRLPVSVGRVFYIDSARSVPFHLEALVNLTENCSDHTMFNVQVTAMFFPTSYGPVIGAASQAGDNPEAVPITFVDDDGNSHQMYEVDLRYYELRAKEARARALEAELELHEARDRAEGIRD